MLISPMSSLFAHPQPVNWYSGYLHNRQLYSPFSWTVTLTSHQKLSQQIIQDRPKWPALYNPCCHKRKELAIMLMIPTNFLTSTWNGRHS